MLEVSTDIIQAIIDRAHEFHGKEGVVIPESPEEPGGDWAMQVLASHTGDMTYQEVRNIINDLEPDQQVQLVALMWVGRGDFSEEEWGEALEQAGDNWNKRTAEYLLATPLLADYLEEGLSVMGQGKGD